MRAITQEGCTDTVGESALKVDSGRKIPCCTGEWNLSQWCAGPVLYYLSYTPAPILHLYAGGNNNPWGVNLILGWLVYLLALVFVELWSKGGNCKQPMTTSIHSWLPWPSVTIFLFPQPQWSVSVPKFSCPHFCYLLLHILLAYNQWMKEHGGSIVNIIADMYKGFPTMRYGF